MIDPHGLCYKWVKRLGAGFHPDKPATAYDLDAETAAEYALDMRALFAMPAPANPYECAMMALADRAHYDEAYAMKHTAKRYRR